MYYILKCASNEEQPLSQIIALFKYHSKITDNIKVEKLYSTTRMRSNFLYIFLFLMIRSSISS